MLVHAHWIRHGAVQKKVLFRPTLAIDNERASQIGSWFDRAVEVGSNEASNFSVWAIQGDVPSLKAVKQHPELFWFLFRRGLKINLEVFMKRITDKETFESEVTICDEHCNDGMYEFTWRLVGNRALFNWWALKDKKVQSIVLIWARFLYEKTGIHTGSIEDTLCERGGGWRSPRQLALKRLFSLISWHWQVVSVDAKTFRKMIWYECVIKRSPFSSRPTGSGIFMLQFTCCPWIFEKDRHEPYQLKLISSI